MRSSLVALVLLLLLADSALAVRGRVACPGRRDFQACYLTTEDPLVRNYATLLAGMDLEVLGRAPNGRWRVRVDRLRDSCFVPHDGWPRGGEAVGYVNPEFLTVDGGGADLPTPDVAGDANVAVDPTVVRQADEAAGRALDLLGQLTAGVTDDAGDETTAVAAPPLSGLVLNLPPRAENAMTGSAFLAATATMSRSSRERAIQAQILAGNVPSHLRRLVPVTLRSNGHEGVVYVTPDYLAIGSDEDFVRIPMAPAAAQRIADVAGCLLPTTRIVDQAWGQASVKLAPRPLTPGAQMMSNEWYRRANELVETERAGRPLTLLTAGDKKDVVITNRLASHPGKVAIYGWHQLNGKAIQPLSTVHEVTYADYSHGVRLVAGQCRVDGAGARLDAVLADPNLAPLASSEGPIRRPRYE